MLLAAGAAQAFGALGSEANGATGEVSRVFYDPKRGLSRAYALFALHSHEKRMSGNRFHDVTVSVFSGPDAFSLSYQTNGAPVLTVSHSNAPPAPPAVLNSRPGESNSPRLEKPVKSE